MGAAVAAELAAEGCRVLVHGRDHRSAEQVAGKIRADGGSATVALADIADEKQLGALTATAIEHEVDILIANAGPFVENDWDHVDPEAWTTAYQGNVVSTATLINALLPAMRVRGWGRIITIGSRAVLTPLTNMVEYSGAKAAVLNMTVSLAQHLAGTGITANCVSPGVILTPSLRRMFLDRLTDRDLRWADIEGEVTAEYAPNPSGRLGRPEDIAAAVTFLASPSADYINAAHLRVDGGITGAV